MKQRHRWLAFWSAMALLLGVAVLMSTKATALAKAPTQDRKEEEEDPKKKKPTKEKEEEEEMPSKKPGANLPAGTPPRKAPETLDLRVTLDLNVGKFNLQSEAEKLKGQYPEAAKLLEEFVKAQDFLVTRDALGKVNRQPIRPLFDRYDKDAAGPLKYEPLASGVQREMPRNLIESVEHYELRAQQAVLVFLQQQSAKQKAGAADAVPPYWTNRAAEMVLQEVLSYHESAINRKQRREGWGNIARELRNSLFQAQLAQINALKAAKDWGNAYELCRVLYQTYMGNKELEGVIEGVYVAHADNLINEQKNWLQARLRLRALQEAYPFHTTGEVRRVENRLQEHALKAFNAAKKLKEEGKLQEMVSQLEEANEAWPETRGLPEFRQSVKSVYTSLIVGVRHLPKQISPTTAVTDSEKRAVRLIFEPLVNLRAGPSAQEGYIYKLGDELRRIDQGHEIVLPDSLKWSDGTPVRAEDVLRSWELVASARDKSPLFDIDTANLLEARAPDERRVELIFKRSVMDPFAYLTFPLVPAKRMPKARDEAFGRDPIGSGPFMLKSRDAGEVVFTANPHYKRWHAPNGPKLQEIRFVRFDDFEVAKRNLQAGTWHMLLDLTTDEMRQLSGNDRFAVTTPSAPKEGAEGMSNPRVWFLAANQRQGRPLANENLRKAIGFAIDRDAILNQVFGRQDRQPHKALDGPYPLDSWAYDRSTNFSAFNGEIANAEKEKVKTVPTLSLKYPAEVWGAKEACERIRNQLRTRGITLNVEGMPQSDLATLLSKADAEYDLIYWCYDFEDERLSLRPLFDASGIGDEGRNYLGTTGGLEQLFINIQTHRAMDYTVKQYNQLHRAIADRMLLIPLWQIDTHVAWNRKLKFPRMHPLWVFDHPELWSLGD